MKRYLPSVTWGVALVALFFMDANSPLSLCLSKLLGLGACLGCGIGHAVQDVLHLRLAASLDHHWLGIPVTLALLWLVIQPFLSKLPPYEPGTSDDAGPAAQ